MAVNPTEPTPRRSPIAAPAPKVAPAPQQAKPAAVRTPAAPEDVQSSRGRGAAQDEVARSKLEPAPKTKPSSEAQPAVHTDGTAEPKLMQETHHRKGHRPTVQGPKRGIG